MSFSLRGGKKNNNTDLHCKNLRNKSTECIQSPLWRSEILRYVKASKVFIVRRPKRTSRFRHNRRRSTAYRYTPWPRGRSAPPTCSGRGKGAESRCARFTAQNTFRRRPFLPPFHLPLRPLPRGKLILEQVVFVFEVGVGIDVSCVAT